MTRVRFCHATDLTQLQDQVNRVIETLEQEGYGIETVRYQAGECRCTAMVLYSQGKTRLVPFARQRPE